MYVTRLILVAGIVAAPVDASAQDLHFHGTGSNPPAGPAFVVKITLDATNAPVVTGLFDVTGLPGAAIVCGKGSYQGALVGDALTFSLIDVDDDPGCGAGGRRIAVDALLTSDHARLEGVVSVDDTPAGMLTAHRAGQWSGSGNNLTLSTPWIAQAWFAFAADGSVVGELDATQAPGDPVICGRGIFAGTRDGDLIEFAFTSNDPDPGCGFDRGWIIYMTASIAADEASMAGAYAANDPLQQNGTWTVRLPGIFRDGFEPG